ncbi:lytic transglycosylase domain-containing protein [Paraflavitalea sp. CAU 1676]|uniref:lytic transglycosylase domain-containing protein n=1 Tax=Paraflavitalea sp. CAU 1676 TaxID=3032598 RepID=UPI0023DA736D|nr:lytic transglycosylase domain-containing protein [Paraflavitalea sp. CAU 1676]MDF2193250.1 transglycosylase SLT domain-containing protein [Paraflavitalea sp. CAU 1676]
MKQSIVLVLFVCLVAIACLLAAFKEQKQQEQPLAAAGPAATTKPVFQPPPLPDSMKFAGESVPLYRRDIREQLDREVLYNYYQPNNILYIIKLTNRYFPLIEQRLKANGVPADMKYLCVAESNLQQLISKAGAVGFWQFMSDTAPGYGLEVNAYVDERYHVERSTDAACAYLKRAYDMFGSWTAAAASYNCGMAGYHNQAQFQRKMNYYDLNLPEETNRYIFRILTFKYFLSQAAALGFVVPEGEGYPVLPIRRMEIQDGISNLADFALQQGITYKTLRQYNPWIRGRSLPARKGKTYVIHLPADADATTAAPR